MRTLILAAFALLFQTASAEPTSNVLAMLQGEWLSDKDGTLTELRKNAWWTEERLATITSTLGRLTVRYEGSTCFSEMDDWKATYEVRVINENGNKATLEWEDPALGIQRSTIEVFDDHVWVIPNESKVYRERFTRIQK